MTTTEARRAAAREQALAQVSAAVAAPKVFLSLGAGVQSSTLARMCAVGFLPFKVHAAIFADTQAEPPAVYEWLRWLEKQLPFPVLRVTKGNLATDALVRRTSKKGKRYWQVQVPVFIANPGGTKGKLGRKCTSDYKVKQIVRRMRAEVGQRNIRAWQRAYDVRRERVEVEVKKRGVWVTKKEWRWVVPPGTPPLALSLIGISIDEVQRVKTSREPWVRNVYPLVDARISRADCLAWMKRQGHPEPPRSACVFCPYHSDEEWLRMKREDPASFEAAVKWEAAAAATACEITRGTPFLHKSLVPLPMVEFKEKPPSAQRSVFGGWGNECEGMCGI